MPKTGSWSQHSPSDIPPIEASETDEDGGVFQYSKHVLIRRSDNAWCVGYYRHDMGAWMLLDDRGFELVKKIAAWYDLPSV